MAIARRAGDKSNKIVNDTLKKLGYTDKQVNGLLDSVNEKGKNLSEMSDVIREEPAALESMKATIDGWTGSRDELQAYIAEGASMIPLWSWGRLALTCFFTMLAPSTITFPSFGETPITLPTVPLELPEITITWSPVLT